MLLPRQATHKEESTMRYGIRIIATLGLVALLVPVAAVAKDARVEGPAALVGAGYFGGELELAMEDGQRPVRILGRAGYIGVLDLGGDLKIRCIGKGRVQKKETDAGMVYTCAGRKGGEVVLLGSHFTFRGFSTRYKAFLPAGANGSFHGRYVVRGPGGEGETARKTPGRAPKPVRELDEIPSLDELAGMLDALDG
jgi:hypothetical protein